MQSFGQLWDLGATEYTDILFCAMQVDEWYYRKVTRMILNTWISDIKKKAENTDHDMKKTNEEQTSKKGRKNKT